jgi:hypothetical protein
LTTPSGDSPFGNRSGQPGCRMSKATQADGIPITALEKVEIRGKIVQIEGPEDGHQNDCPVSQNTASEIAATVAEYVATDFKVSGRTKLRFNCSAAGRRVEPLDQFGLSNHASFWGLVC